MGHFSVPTLEWLASPAQWHDIGDAGVGLKAEYRDTKDYSAVYIFWFN
jgi:hypothetical protein